MDNYNFKNFDDLKKFIDQKKFEKIFLITGKKSYFKSGAEKKISPILRFKKIYNYFKLSPYPEIKELKIIIDLINKFNPDLILAIGGGSVIDYAKIAKLNIDSKNLKTNIIEGYKAKKCFKLAAIPTTAGSGAEVTENAVIYINKKKYSVEGREVKPDYHFLIPELIVDSAKTIKSSAGFDAISQAIESLISIKSNKSSVMYAQKSLRLSLENFENFVNKPNYNNSMRMSIAANLSGKAINISKTTAPHALSYPFTAYFDIPHGQAVSLTLNEFLKFNYDNHKKSVSTFDLQKRFKLIFDLAKVSNINQMNTFLKKIKSNTGLENNFKKLGISIKRDYSKILSGVNIQRLKNNPIDLNQNDIKNILLKKNEN